MLEYGDIITLEDKEQYVVASTCEYNSEIFVYIVNIKNSMDCILAILKNDELEQVTDINLFNNVMPLILDNASEEIFGGDNEDG